MIVFRDIERLFTYDQELIGHLFSVWQTNLIESTDSFDVYRLEKKAAPGADKVRPAQQVQATTTTGLTLESFCREARR